MIAADQAKAEARAAQNAAETAVSSAAEQLHAMQVECDRLRQQQSQLSRVMDDSAGSTASFADAGVQAQATAFADVGVQAQAPSFADADVQAQAPSLCDASCSARESACDDGSPGALGGRLGDAEQLCAAVRDARCVRRGHALFSPSGLTAGIFKPALVAPHRSSRAQGHAFPAV